MENTVCENCPFVKQGFCNDVRECPNYLETWWQIQDGNKTNQKLVKDCAPKRMTLISMSLQNQMEAVQISNEQSRNEYNRLNGYLCNLIESSKTVLENSSQKRLLPECKADLQLDYEAGD